MKNSTYTLFHNWHVMRWFRLLLGLAFLIQAIYIQEALSGLIAAFFLFQAITDSGCCGSNGCTLPMQKNEHK